MSTSSMGKVKDGWIYVTDYFDGEDREFPEWVDYRDSGREDRISLDTYEDKLSYRFFEIRVDYRIRLSDGNLEIIKTSFDTFTRAEV